MGRGMSDESAQIPPQISAPPKRTWPQRVRALFAQPIKLPGWATIFLFFIIQIPDWKSRIDFWLDVAKSSGGYFAMIATVIASPYFSPAMAVTGLLWIAFVGEPDKGVQRHHWLRYLGWAVFSICLTVLILTVGYGAFQVLVHEQVNNADMQLQRQYGAHPSYWHLTQFQKEALANAAKNVPEKDRFVLQILCLPDAGSRTYMSDIGEIFIAANWKITPNCLFNNVRPDLTGAYIGVSKSLAEKVKAGKADKEIEKHMSLLATLFNEAKVPGSWSMYDDGTKQDNFYLIIGNPP
jgi:hypothetical protein